jgi:surface antigen
MTTKGIVTAVAVGSALSLGAPTATAPANADATGTVKARTQRTTAPNLNSQDGVYNVGDKLTLVCHTAGQAVKGFFSLNIPNDGWDNLWYRTPDGHYVASVDIETGTLHAVGPQCGKKVAEGASAPAPPPASDAATNRSIGPTIDHNPLGDYAGYCTWGAQEQIHDHTGYYIKALTGNAEDWASEAMVAGWTVVGDAQPRSIAVFGSSLVGGVGHVAWVDAVNGKAVTITEMNFGPGATAANGYHTTGFRNFDSRTFQDVPGMSYILIP